MFILFFLGLIIWLIRDSILKKKAKKQSWYAANITNREPGNYYKGLVVCPVCHTGRRLIVSEFAFKQNRDKAIWHTCRNANCIHIFETSIGEIVRNAERMVEKKNKEKK